MLLMGKSSISMAIFNSELLNDQRVTIMIHLDTTLCNPNKLFFAIPANPRTANSTQTNARSERPTKWTWDEDGWWSEKAGFLLEKRWDLWTSKDDMIQSHKSPTWIMVAFRIYMDLWISKDDMIDRRWFRAIWTNGKWCHVTNAANVGVILFSNNHGDCQATKWVKHKLARGKKC